MSNTTKPDESAFASNTEPGLTKREYFAAMAMQGLLANSYNDGATQPLSTANNKQIASMAVGQADALIEELNK